MNRFTVAENLSAGQAGKYTRWPDVVLFVNGMPLAVIKLKNAASEDTTTWTTFQQPQTHQAEVLVVSDGAKACAGTLTAGREWFKPWRTIAGEALADAQLPKLQVVTERILTPRRFLDLVRDFIVFEDDLSVRQAGGSQHLIKKMVGYHQFHAVPVAACETLRAAKLARADRVAENDGRYEAGGRPGDRRVGVVWHTQGSGKSLTMAFYGGRIIREKIAAAGSARMNSG